MLVLRAIPLYRHMLPLKNDLLGTARKGGLSINSLNSCGICRAVSMTLPAARFGFLCLNVKAGPLIGSNTLLMASDHSLPICLRTKPCIPVSGSSKIMHMSIFTNPEDFINCSFQGALHLKRLLVKTNPFINLLFKYLGKW